MLGRPDPTALAMAVALHPSAPRGARLTSSTAVIPNVDLTFTRSRGHRAEWEETTGVLQPPARHQDGAYPPGSSQERFTRYCSGPPREAVVERVGDVSWTAARACLSPRPTRTAIHAAMINRPYV